MKLSEELKKWRADRPDEWKMDEFTRKAKQLEQAIASAPDLLEALEEMTNAVKEKAYHPELEHLGGLVIHAESVIKKARGIT